MTYEPMWKMDTMSYPKKTIYLAGPITGLTHDEARYGWRKKFKDLIYSSDHIHCVSPMRGKEFLKDFGKLTAGKGYPDNPIASASGIVHRDLFDIRGCNIMVACFLESENKASIGTAIEYGIAWENQKPVIAVGDPDEINVHHIMMHYMTAYHVDNLEDAAHIARLLLTPGL